MLNEFVEKILVHERSRKGSQDTTQEIEIYFNFLGRYIPPSLQPVPLTPEEQEELRKKEELAEYEELIRRLYEAISSLPPMQARRCLLYTSCLVTWYSAYF